MLKAVTYTILKNSRENIPQFELDQTRGIEDLSTSIITT